ncbi:uncharacterized protein MONOS_18520 [Monocercomonoides exilis]|uniref:uncharacterized protein n=1 Tax=Monocercomonoides exilis TaxID=2049356 RepID=UPI00355A1D6C|nr:hypothetical protein MONOS_18520 [Monocercomonoides exilis]
MGYCNVLRRIFTRSFFDTSLSRKFEQMIANEVKKKGEKNEKLLIGLCECCVTLRYIISPELFSICFPYLLKVVLKKEENEETQKEVEIALLALRHANYRKGIEELYLNEIIEIIRYHQEHHNLTQLAYQSTWEFLMSRPYFDDESLEEVVVNELCFCKEAKREIEELSKSVDWRRTEEEKERGKKGKEEIILLEWLKTLDIYFYCCRLRIEEINGLLKASFRFIEHQGIITKK